MTPADALSNGAPVPEEISNLEARRIALAAQGFGPRRPSRPGRAHLHQLLDRLGLFQIDSVNVLTRAHYLPAFSRIGAFDRGLRARGLGPKASTSHVRILGA